MFHALNRNCLHSLVLSMSSFDIATFFKAPQLALTHSAACIAIFICECVYCFLFFSFTLFFTTPKKLPLVSGLADMVTTHHYSESTLFPSSESTPFPSSESTLFPSSESTLFPSSESTLWIGLFKVTVYKFWNNGPNKQAVYIKVLKYGDNDNYVINIKNIYSH